MKIKKKTKILLYFWLPTENYHKHLAIWIWILNFLLQNLANLAPFFHEKSFEDYLMMKLTLG